MTTRPRYFCAVLQVRRPRTTFDESLLEPENPGSKNRLTLTDHRDFSIR